MIGKLLDFKIHQLKHSNMLLSIVSHFGQAIIFDMQNLSTPI